MKNIIYLVVVFALLISCNKENDYVTFSGEILNRNADSLIVFHPKTNFKKVIKLNKDGSFKDTLTVENGLFSITDSKYFTLLYLMNGDNVTMSFDGSKFTETISFIGDHAKENNFLKTSIANENELFSDVEFMSLPKNDFDTKVTNYVADFNNRLDKENFDTDFLNYQKKEIVQFEKYLVNGYLKKNKHKTVLKKGAVSPMFHNYENLNGGTTSLNDLKGKYVYIDIWATWCNPCKEEIPFLKKMETKFHNKNIEFVSISLDDKRDYKVWKDMVLKEELGGVQLYANGDQNFTNAYKVRSIPRFILIDPEGKIVEANAPRPSSPSLIQLLNNLNL